MSVPVMGGGGFVAMVESMGDDDAIAEAARVSYADGTKQVRSNEGLIRYLMRKRHTSPFEMPRARFHVRVPVYVARQWMRHRTGSFSEISARYSEIPSGFHIPQIAAQSEHARQGRGGSLPNGEELHAKATAAAEASEACYREMLEAGAAREVARSVLPTAMWTEFQWNIDLHNLLRFIELRSAPSAQAEMQECAQALAQHVEEWCPVAAKAHREHVQEAVVLSKDVAQLASRFLRREKATFLSDLEDVVPKLSKSEIREIQEWLEREPSLAPTDQEANASEAPTPAQVQNERVLQEIRRKFSRSQEVHWNSAPVMELRDTVAGFVSAIEDLRASGGLRSRGLVSMLGQIVDAIRAFPAGELRNSRTLMEKLLRRLQGKGAGAKESALSQETDKEIQEIVFWFQAENETLEERQMRLKGISERDEAL